MWVCQARIAAINGPPVKSHSYGPFLDDESKRNILGYNAARVFNLEIPDKYRLHNAAE